MKKYIILLLILLMWTVKAHATVQFDASSTNNCAPCAGTTLSLTQTVTTQPYRYLVVLVANVSATSAVTGVTYNGVSLTKEEDETGSSREAMYWDLVNPASGTKGITVTFGTSGAGRGIATALSFYGVNQTTPFSNGTKTTGATQTPAITITSAAGNMAVSVMATNANSGSNTFTPDSSWQTVTNANVSNDFAEMGYKIGAASVSYSGSFSSSVIGWNMAGGSVNAANNKSGFTRFIPQT